MTSIVVAAGEVGSGTAGAAGGQHFSNLTPRGVPGYPEHNVRENASTTRRVILELHLYLNRHNRNLRKCEYLPLCIVT